jgi:predicted AlkP superfamily phosphohydrolase/phosphomutase
MKQRGKLYVMGVDQMVLPLTKQMIKEGCVPTLAKLMERGSVYQALASYPCYTPNNWQSIATGANTGTHGVLSWFVHMPDGEDVSSLTSLGVNAETLWEAAERQGLTSAVVHYPGSSPSKLKTGYVIDGNAGPIFGGCPYEIATAEAYMTKPPMEHPAVKPLQLTPAQGWRGLPTGGPPPLAAAIPVSTKEEADRHTWQLLVLGGPNGYDRAVICREQDLSTAVGETRLGAWSEWATVPFGNRTGTVRFKLVALTPDASTMALYRSQIMPRDGWSEPDAIGGELIDRLGPFVEHVSQVFDVMGVVDYATCVEEGDYQGQWLAKAALYLTQEKGCDLFFCHWHFLDDVNHYHLAHLDPFWFRYDPQEAPQHWAKVRRAYQAVDRMMATLLEGITEDDYVVIVSDHGCSPINRLVYMERFLFDQGYLVFKDPKTPKTMLAKDWYNRLDWEKTKVWLHEGVFLDPFNIYINAKTDAEYQTIQRDLLRDLRTWVDEQSQQTVAALALAKRDAQLLGLWGDQLGDVVVVLEAGYQMAKAEGQRPLEDNMGNLSSGHARMLPTAEHTYGTQKAIFLLSGPGVKQGYERPAEKLGDIHLIDVAPTLAHLLGIEPPVQTQGTVVRDLLEGYEMVQERPAKTPYYKPTAQYKAWIQRFFKDRDVLAEEVVPC